MLGLSPVFSSTKKNPALFAHHTEAVAQMVQWALGKLDTEDRITIRWKDDAEYRETVTKFELRDHELLIEFAHPPAGLRAPGASA